MNLATIGIPLVPNVLARDFGNLIVSIDDLYYQALWLDRAERNVAGYFPDDNYGPDGIEFDDEM